MTEKLKNKINDEQLKIRAISDEKITVNNLGLIEPSVRHG